MQNLPQLKELENYIDGSKMYHTDIQLIYPEAKNPGDHVFVIHEYSLFETNLNKLYIQEFLVSALYIEEDKHTGSIKNFIKGDYVGNEVIIKMLSICD